jgi:F-type H+-transporting ATPase subunit delta
MAQTSSARRYAEAIFQFHLETCADQLDTAAELLASDDAERVLDNPSLPVRERQAAVDRVLEGRVDDPVRRLVDLLVERGKVDLLPRVAAEYRRLLNRQSGVVSAVVTSAVALKDDEIAAITERVRAMTGDTVDLRTAVDPDLIGGLTVQVGDRLLDASVRGRLERLRSQLLAGTRAG